ncbi:alpha/beta hydrolase-fold protein [Bombilactobacillus folatiphilus]|uniref:Alpha/beta hydrolase-fold protein n=1 Tax=Bombilactobacillus folatiphilus TaxID=2923362 RepID=A0ABY4P784_9LACO|nr:alpha/beta hydrolase-fold protein [Bombilactobacillus folatiphilus]UQS81461.1 alpha/beta hydrolase-fold protein [Bombilactobacillus folatiphilus]
MALLKLTRFSLLLQNQCTTRILLPDNLEINQPLTVIWLLHGLGDNGTCWLRKTTLEQITSNYRIAVIMPDMGRSFYTNAKDGLPYWDYLTEELIPQMRRLLPLSNQRSENYLLGNSMGGFGAFKLAFKHPNWFQVVATFSPVVDLNIVKTIMPDYTHIFGSQIPQNYLQKLAKQSSPEQLTSIHWQHTIGQNDFMKDANDQFAQWMKTLKLDYTYTVSPGQHDWSFWENELVKLFKIWQLPLV